MLDEENIIRVEADPLYINPVHGTSNPRNCSEDIFFVIELSKVLTDDPDKALIPYIHPEKNRYFPPINPTVLGIPVDSCINIDSP